MIFYNRRFGEYCRAAACGLILRLSGVGKYIRTVIINNYSTTTRTRDQIQTKRQQTPTRI